MTQMDVICELEILTENDKNRIIIRFVLPCLFCCQCTTKAWFSESVFLNAL